ncbi:MAG: sigma-54-dependent Fis family transcriptional regulator [Candidatus Hydrogenedentes bacterium]|nr:sigma-54-dependent Fis family transcriptional regulator [Candidatus Hydrogenedentota bacterium]
MKSKILITEDDQVQREIIADILLRAEYEVEAVGSGRETLAALEAEEYDLLLTDMRMPEMDGLELLRRAKRLRPEMEAVVMTAHATVETAVTAMKEGAVDYLAKPFDKDELLIVVAKALEQGDLRRQNAQLRRLVADSTSLGNIVGEGEQMQAVFDIVNRAVPLSTTVLIRGESGTGKELVARHIHFAGPRKNRPFIVVNCAAMPDNLVESELFGHEKGAFTGAETGRAGKFETADGGTLFLDEIGDMRLESQAKLLRVLHDGVVERVGGTRTTKVDVRVLAATNRDLEARVEEGEFRRDLYYRLDVLNIVLPPLRDRIDELAPLIAHFREKLAMKLGMPSPELSADVVDAMRKYRWPGNVRELENTLEQLFILNDASVIGMEQLPEKLRRPRPNTGEVTLPAGGLSLDALERNLIRQAMEQSGGQIKEAAVLLGLTYKTLQYRLKKHDIDRKTGEGS